MFENGPNYLLVEKKAKFNPGCLKENLEQKFGTSSYRDRRGVLYPTSCRVVLIRNGRNKAK